MPTPLRNALMTLALLLLGAGVVHAQDRSVTGTVMDGENGEPLPGVNVTAPGTNVGTTTNPSGEYSLTVPQQADSLAFSFVGYQRAVRAIQGRSEINVTLQPSVEQLENVVVTALGIEREQRALGYAAEEVDGAEIEESGQPDLLNALSGKVSGVNITNKGGAPGGGSRIIIRGITSLNPGANNQPLFVVDGVPIDNSTIEAGDTPRSLSNRASDLDPSNIKSVNILKSGAATALYGTRAANGAVVITTKSGQAGDMQINISSTAEAERVARYPEFQKVYGQGFAGEATTDSFWPNWGARISEVADTLDGWQYHDIWRDAMQTGATFDNAISVSGGSEDVTYYASVSNLQQRGVIPYGDRDRTNVKLSGDLQPFETLSISSSINYINSGGNHVPADRFMERLMYWAPTKDVTNFEQPSGTQRGYYGNGNAGTNPLYDAKYSTYETDVNRVIGNVSFDYSPMDWLNLTYRLGLDYYNDNRTNITPGPLGIEGENPLSSTGFVTQERINSRDLTSTINVTLEEDLTDQIGATLRLGNDIFDQRLDRVTASGDDFAAPRVYDLSNVRSLSSDQRLIRQRLIGVYGDLTLDYGDYLYLNLTARNDWSSTLPEQNRSFFYPSVSTSFIFSDVLDLPDFISYGKLRASAAEVGKDAEPYLTSVTFTSPSIYPLDGRVGYTRSGLLGSQDLVAENTTTFEVGTNVRFFDNRLGLNLTVYQSNSAHQILRVPVSNATGFTEFATNAGEIRNRGIELQLTGTPVQTDAFTWDATLNFTRNRNTVVDIREGIDEIIVGSQFGYAGSSPTIKLVEGDAYGNIYGTSYQRYYPNGEPEDNTRIDEDRPILIGEDGFPVVNNRDKVVGNSQPDWTAGLSNTLSYKSLRLSFLIDVRKGGDVFNQFDNFFTAFGITKETLARDEFRVFDGVTADGTPNEQRVWLGQGVGPDGRDYGAGYYRNVKRGVTEEFVHDASYVKLRNVQLSWGLPQQWVSATSFLKQVRLSAGVNNIILYTPLENAFDPESRSGGAGDNATGFTGLDYPGTSSVRFTVDFTL